MTPAPEFDVLVQAYLDGVLDDAAAIRLRDVLRADDAKLDFFLRAADLHGFLAGLRAERIPAKTPAAPERPRLRSSRTRLRTVPPRASIGLRLSVAAAVLFASVMLYSLGRPSPARAPVVAATASQTSALTSASAAPEPASPRVAEERIIPLAALRPPEETEEERRRREAADADRREALERLRVPSPTPAPLPPPPKPAAQEAKTEPRVSVIREIVKVYDGMVFGQKPTIVQFAKAAEIPDETELIAHRNKGGAIVWADGTWMRLQPGTVFKIVRDQEARRIRVVSGTIDSQIAKQTPGRPMIFETAQSESEILGTMIHLTVSPDPSIGTTLEVREGRVKFTKKGGRSVEVAGGQFAVASPTADPSPSRISGMDEEFVFVFGPPDTRYDKTKYRLDSGATFDADRGYGWRPSLYERVNWDGTLSGHVGAGRNTPSTPPEEARAGHVAAGWGMHADTWVMPIPNGSYRVTVGVGDWSVAHGPNRVMIEDKVFIDGLITRKQDKYYAEATYEVTVRDGELTMVCGGSESKKLPPDRSLDTILNYLVIRRLK